jgi:ABC-type branched-subunit amino acid transport system substrate-binding protein
LAFLGIATMLLVAGCRHRSNSNLQDPASVTTPQELDDRLEDAWDAVVEAIARDPASDAVDRAADDLLRKNPPPSVALAAWQAKANRAFAAENDALAFEHAKKASDLAETIGASLDPSAKRSLLLTLARLEIRSGDGEKGVILVDQADAIEAMSALDHASLHALAYDRAGQHAEAAAAYAKWRALVDEKSADAAYSESRLRVHLPAATSGELAALAEQAEDDDVRACLVRAALGQHAVQASQNEWLKSCDRAFARVGVLLPRSGKLAALADTHLAAVTATISEFSAQGRLINVAVEDPGSDAQSAIDAANRLVAQGVETVIVPPTRSQAQAVANALTGQVRLLGPLESIPGVDGSAAGLSARVDAMVRLARREKKTRIVVLVPDQSYGKQVLNHAIRSAKRAGIAVKSVVYPPKATSFHAFVSAPVQDALAGAAVLIGDSMARTELIVRQLRRDGLEPNSQDQRSPLVLATGEGLSADLVSGRHAAFDGVWFAPAAPNLGQSAIFNQEFARQQGYSPDDQAHLVREAIRTAIDGQNAPSSSPTSDVVTKVAPALLRIFNEQIVQTPSET